MSYLQCMFFLIVFILINSISCSTNDVQSTTRRSIAQQFAAEIEKIDKSEKELEEEEKQLEKDREKFEEEKQISKMINPTDVFIFNVGGEIMMTTRETLTRIPKSIFSLVFNGRWEHKLQRDQEGNIFLDFNPILFRHLLDQLQIIEINIHPPSQPSLVEPFKKMIRKLGLQQSLSSEKKNVITFNVGGQTITNQRTTLAQVSNSTFDTIVPPSKMTNFNNPNDVFVDYDPKLFQHLINQLRKESFKSISSFGLLSEKEKISFETMLIDLKIFVVATTTTTSTTTLISTTTTSTTARKSTTTTSATTIISTTTRSTKSKKQQLFIPNLTINQTWKQDGTTKAGGHGQGNGLNQLSHPYGVFIDDDQTIYIADWENHRIVEWKSDAINGQIVAGENGRGNRNDQLYGPKKVIFDKENDSLIICDSWNERVVRWPRRNARSGEILISNIACWDLIMDNDGYLYVSDYKKHEVRRWKMGEKNGTIVAGGNGQGNRLNQLNYPWYIFIDEDHSVYVSDYDNHRVMKWVKDAKEGIVVAGGQGQGKGLRQLSYPHGIIVDELGSVYVADYGNHRVIRWLKGAQEGTIVVGGNGQGEQPNQFHCPMDLSFDRQNNLYVVDHYNHRVQKFDVNST